MHARFERNQFRRRIFTHCTETKAAVCPTVEPTRYQILSAALKKKPKINKREQEKNCRNQNKPTHWPVVSRKEKLIGRFSPEVIYTSADLHLNGFEV